MKTRPWRAGLSVRLDRWTDRSTDRHDDEGSYFRIFVVEESKTCRNELGKDGEY